MTPSDGFVREAYPAIHIDSVGVTSTTATPAFQMSFSSPSAAHAVPNSTGENRVTQKLAKLKNAGITTVMCGCDPLFLTFLTAKAKEWAALTSWVIYVVILAERWRGGWGGRRAAWLAIAGFAVVVFTFAWATLVPGVVVAAR